MPNIYICNIYNVVLPNFDLFCIFFSSCKWIHLVLSMSVCHFN